jgi:hypothetical protein
MFSGNDYDAGHEIDKQLRQPVSAAYAGLSVEMQEQS